MAEAQATNNNGDASAIDNERQALLRTKPQGYIGTWLQARRSELAESGQLHVILDLTQWS